VKFEIHAPAFHWRQHDTDSFNSNGVGARAVHYDCQRGTGHDFDFQQLHLLDLKARLPRNNSALFADLGAIEIYEKSGIESLPVVAFTQIGRGYFFKSAAPFLFVAMWVFSKALRTK